MYGGGRFAESIGHESWAEEAALAGTLRKGIHGEHLIHIKQFALPLEFNANSSQQLIEYCKFKGYPLKKDRKTGKPTSGEDALLEIIDSFPNDALLPLALDVKHVKKGLGDLKDAHLGRDGRFHSLFTYKPDTGRLASQAPNLMNLPQGRAGGVEEEIARLIRSTIVPDSDHTLLEFDWKAIEAVLTGWFANDPDYVKLSLLDSHGFFTSYILAARGVIPEAFQLTDPDLESKLNWLKKTYPTERALGKQINLATGYGMKAGHLASRVKCSLADAALYLKLKDAMAPKVAKWKTETQQRAHKEGRLVNPFGYVRAFFAVYERRKDGTWRLGKEANEALAFLPQSTGAAMLRASIVDLFDLLEGPDLARILIPVHDSILLQCLPSKVEEVVGIVRGVMEQAWKELNGLSISTSCKIGSNWSSMKDYVPA